MSRKLVLLVVIAALTALMVAVSTAGSGVAQVEAKKDLPPVCAKEDAKAKVCTPNKKEI